MAILSLENCRGALSEYRNFQGTFSLEFSQCLGRNKM